MSQEPPDSQFEQSDNQYNRIKTNFLDKQAEQNAASIFQSLPMQILMGIAAIGLMFVAWKVADFFLNLDKNNAVKNVLLKLEKPILRDGVAIADVRVENFNARSISKLRFRYNILGASGNTVDTGEVTIPDTVPAGDGRTFTNVKLGPLTDNSSRMQAELSDLTLGPKSDLPAAQESRFSDIAALKDDEKVEQFKQFVADNPGFVPGEIELGRAYAATNELDKAVDVLKKAVELEPKNGNTHFHLALAYQRDGHEHHAADELHKALDLLPDDPDVQRTVQYFGVPTTED
ncbi:MAG TPA: tetratricopeptide repeat protein [Trichormus sp.]|jgi:tetratricopeptide (TPR) repeat protein